MQVEGLLSALLGAIGLRLPVLIAVCVALVWLLPAPRGPARTGALVGLLLLASVSVLNMLVSLVPLWLLNAGDFTTASALGQVIGEARLVLGVLEAFALVLVIWALTRALRLAFPLPPRLP